MFLRLLDILNSSVVEKEYSFVLFCKRSKKYTSKYGRCVNLCVESKKVDSFLS